MTQFGGKKHHKTAKKHHVPATGSRAEVFHGNAKHTSGGLEKKDLKKNKHGRIVSIKASKTAKRKNTIKRLHNAGYKAKKGVFKLFKKSSKKRGGRGRVGSVGDVDEPKRKDVAWNRLWSEN